MNNDQIHSITFKTSDQCVNKVTTKPSAISDLLTSLKEYNEECQGEIIQVGSNDTNLHTIGCYSNNGLVGTVFQAYNEHHNVVLRPDDFWMSVMTQFALYVDGNSEALRSKFVNHEGQKELEVVSGGTLRTVHYGELCKMMTMQIQEKLKDPAVKDWIIPDFTTTTDNDVMVSSVVMMAAMKSYFSYKMSMMCGIPNVTLLGTPEDWKKLRKRLEKLLEYDLDGNIKEWYSLLAPIFDEMVNSSEGNHNLDFWSKSCHYISGGSGPSYISGWISSFSVFNKEGKWQGSKRSVNRFSQNHESKWPIIETSDITQGYVTVPVNINDNGKMYKTMMFAGSFTSTIVNEHTLKPGSVWALSLISLIDEEKIKK